MLIVCLFDRAGTVESRMRQLVMKLEFVESLILAHPFIKGFDQTSYCLNDEEVRACASGDIPEAVAKRKKEDIEDKEGASTVCTTTFYIGLAIEPKQRTYDSFHHVLVNLLIDAREAGATGPRRLDISYPTTEFIKLVKLWEKYEESSMGIIVRHIKRFVLCDIYLSSKLELCKWTETLIIFCQLFATRLCVW